MTLEPVRVLLVEDNPIDARVVQAIVSNGSGTEIALQCVESLAEGLALLGRERFDLVLLDLSLPDVGGLDALRRVRAHRPELPVVVLTGRDDQDTALQAVQEGAQDYLIKGRVERDTLIPALRYAVERQRLLGRLEVALEQRETAEKELQRREEYFRALIENAADIISVLDADGTVIYESPSVAAVLGYRPEERVGTSAFEGVHPDDLPEVQSAFRKGVAMPGHLRMMEFRVRHRDGSWRTLQATGINLLGHAAVGGVVVNSRDVTERRHLEAQLQRAQRLDTVGQLAGGIAHDFNNMLTAIKGTTSLLMMDIRPGEPLREELEEIDQAADRAAALTRQLLAFSSKQTLQPQLLDLNGVVTGMEKMLRRTLGERIEIVTRLEPVLGRVRADPGQMEQVLMNLALNARDAMPENGTLTIRSRNAPAGGGRHANVVELEVSDTGVGMDEDTRSRLFEPFFTTKKPGEGTGLGLSTVYGIMQQSGGSVEVASASGRGSTFTLRLPRVREDDAPEFGPGHAPEAPPTVLLVEDQDSVRRVTRRMLERGGFRVLEAAGGVEALALATEYEGSIDLLLTDVMMPRMTGPQMEERLRPLRPGLRVLFMSGYAADTLGERGHLREGADLLPKPFVADELIERVVQATGFSRSS